MPSAGGGSLVFNIFDEQSRIRSWIRQVRSHVIRNISIIQSEASRHCFPISTVYNNEPNSTVQRRLAQGLS
jgi:hypothetical protein